MNGELPPAAAPVAPIRVVLASRDLVYSASLARRLRRSGMEVVQCVPGPDCDMESAALAACDVLVVETDGPSAGERELVTAARALSPLVEVVTISAKAAVPEAVRAFRSGLFAVLEHPVDADQLIATVAEASCRKRKAEERIRELDRMAAVGAGTARWGGGRGPGRDGDAAGCEED